MAETNDDSPIPAGQIIKIQPRLDLLAKYKSRPRKPNPLGSGEAIILDSPFAAQERAEKIRDFLKKGQEPVDAKQVEFADRVVVALQSTDRWQTVMEKAQELDTDYPELFIRKAAGMLPKAMWEKDLSVEQMEKGVLRMLRQLETELENMFHARYSRPARV